MPGNALQSCQEVYVGGIGIIRSFSLRVSIYALQQMQWGLGYHGAEPVECTRQASGIHNDILSLSHVHLFDPAVSSLSFYVLLNKASARQDVM